MNDDPMSRFARVNVMKVRDVDALAKELRERGFTFEKEDAHLGRGGGGEKRRWLLLHFIRERLRSEEIKRDENGKKWGADFARKVVVHACALFIGK